MPRFPSQSGKVYPRPNDGLCYNRTMPRKKNPPQICPVCSAEFYCPPSYLKKWPNPTCSRACAAVRRLKGKERICQTCGKTFYVRRSQLKQGFGKYCSNECDGAAKVTSISMPCTWCGKPTLRRPWQVEKHDDHFCDIVCYRSWKGRNGNHKSKNSFTQKQKREWIGTECARCGATEELELDHIFPRFAGGTNTRDNAQTLCRKCNRQKYWKEDRLLISA